MNSKSSLKLLSIFLFLLNVNNFVLASDSDEPDSRNECWFNKSRKAPITLMHNSRFNISYSGEGIGQFHEVLSNNYDGNIGGNELENICYNTGLYCKELEELKSNLTRAINFVSPMNGVCSIDLSKVAPGLKISLMEALYQNVSSPYTSWVNIKYAGNVLHKVSSYIKLFSFSGQTSCIDHGVWVNNLDSLDVDAHIFVQTKKAQLLPGRFQSCEISGKGTVRNPENCKLYNERLEYLKTLGSKDDMSGLIINPELGDTEFVALTVNMANCSVKQAKHIKLKSVQGIEESILSGISYGSFLQAENIPVTLIKSTPSNEANEQFERVIEALSKAFELYLKGKVIQCTPRPSLLERVFGGFNPPSNYESPNMFSLSPQIECAQAMITKTIRQDTYLLERILDFTKLSEQDKEYLAQVVKNNPDLIKEVARQAYHSIERKLF